MKPFHFDPVRLSVLCAAAVVTLTAGPVAVAQPSSTNTISGSISVPGERDTYTFSLTNRGRFYFDALTNVSTLNWSLEGPTGLLANNLAFNGSDAGNFTALSLVPGFYRLTVDADTSATPNYSFRFVNLASAGLLTPGTVVTNRLAPASETDFYQYTASAGDRFLFNRLALDAGANVWLRLLDPYGNELFSTSFVDVNTWTQRVAGTFTLMIEGYAGNSGSAGYSFNLEPQGNVVLPPFTGTPLAIGAIASGSLTNASTNAYTFTLAADTRLVFDTLTNSPNVQMFLEGPPGLSINSRALNSSDWINGSAVLDLPAGSYQLRVRRTSAGTEPYRFRLLDFASATLITPGTPVTATLTPTTETDLYRFNASAGSRYYFDFDSTNGPNNAYWRLLDPYGGVVVNAYLTQDRAPLTLTLSGTYTLLVEGYYGDDPGAFAHTFNLVPVTDGAQALTVGALTTGAISVPGQVQQYLLTLTSSATLYFDSRTNSNLRWSLAGPAGPLVNNRQFDTSDASQVPLQLPAGDYTLTVTGSTDDTGGFAFRLLDLASASPLTPGMALTSTLSPANETDAYRFTATAGAKVYFDFIASSGMPNAYWRCFDPYGGEVFRNSLSDHGPVLLPASGTYTLLVEGYVGDSGSGTYTVNVVPVTDGAQSLTIGGQVNGAIAVPGQVQVYNFTLPAPAILYFDSLANNSLRWSLNGPGGNEVNDRLFNSSDASHPPLNLPAGPYTLTVTGSGDDTGSFAFVLRDFATAAPLVLGNPVSGTLDPADQTDLYRFTATAGSEVYFDLITSSSLPNAYWRCFDPSGAPVFYTSLSDHGPVLLPVGGIYTLAVEGYFSDTSAGTYTVNVVPVNDTVQPLTLGSVVSGVLTGPGQTRGHTFTLAAPATFYFDSLTNSTLRWTLTGPAGTIVNARQFSSFDTSQDLLALAPGDYALTINGSGDETGGYRFRLFDMATATPLTPGTPVGTTLNPADETDAWRFNATAGDRFYFDQISRTGIPNSWWRLFDPHGDEVFRTPFSSDAGTNRLLVTGTYTLFIEGYYSDTGSGSYQFNVRPEATAPVTPYTGTPLVIGATISSNLATATTTNTFTFTLAASARLFFDSLVNSGVTWSLEWPSGVLVNSRAFWNSDCIDGNPLLDLSPGNYRLRVTGTPGAYSFRLLDPASATAFTPGTLASDSISPGRGTRLLRFNATAGDRFYFDGRPRTGFTTDPYIRLYPPFGNAIISSIQVDSDVDTFSVPYTGEYILAVEGRYIDTSATGNFSFLLQPVTDGTNTFAVGDTVNSAITHAGQSRYHQFNLASPARLFFDSLTGLGTISWTLTGPSGVIVNARQFWTSDSIDGISLLNLPAGAYTIEVDADSTNSPAYAFRLIDSSSASPFTPGTLVTNSLAPGISSRLYRFNAAAGERFYFDGRARSGFTHDPYVRLVTPLGEPLFAAFSVDSDLDTFSVPLTGDYLMSVEGRYADTSTSGNFSFVLHRVIDGTNTFAIGQAVNGAITGPGQRQFHLFTLFAPARLIFDTLTGSGFPWTLTGPGGVVVNGQPLWSSDAIDGVSLLDLPAGNYTILIEAGGATTGSYSFRLLDTVTAVSFTPGTLVTNALAPGISTALWRFSATAGDRFYFDGRARSDFTQDPYVRIYTPLGDSLLAAFQVDSDVDTFSVPQSGNYLLSVEGRYADTSTNGNYSFVLVRNPPQPPTPLFDTNVAPDLRVTGVAIAPPGGLQSGQAATVSWTTRNDGTAATPGSFTDRITVRNTGTSQVIVNRTLFYDEAANGSINPGQTRNCQLAITLPDGPAGVGNLEVTVTTDTLNNIFEQNGGGTGEANNAVSINITTTLAPYPDLQISSLNVTPSTAWLTGSVVTVSWVITNTGNRATSVSWTESLLVRNTNTSQVIVNANTDYDPANPGNGDVPAGGSRVRSLDFTMPMNDSAYGAFEVTIMTDSGNVVFEHNAGGTAENNNSRSLISASAPDLVVNGLTVTADPSLLAGAELTIQWNTANQGNVPAAGVFYDRVIVRNTNTAEVLLNTALPYNPASGGNGPIDPGGSIAREHTFNLPDGARSVGRLEITIAADTFNQLVEYNGGGTGEANNSTQTQIVIATAPYPDLVVTNIVAPAAGRPGQPVPFIWTIRNVGTVPAVGPWSDHLFLSTDNVIGSDQFLASAFFSGTLAPGASLTRTQQVTLPAFGTGNRWFIAEADASGVLFEERETNNAAIATAPTVIPATLTLTFSPGTVIESAGAQAVLATLTRNSDAAAPLTVALANNRAAKVLVPSSVTIPAGASSTNFFIPVVDDSIADSNVTATITASAAAHVTATNTLTIVENDSPALVLRLSAPSVAENAASISASLIRNAQTNVALIVSLASDRPGTLTVPPTVTIPAGQTNATFALDPVDDDVVTGDRTVSILASAAGFAPVSAALSVLDNDAVTLTLQLSQSSVSESAINPAAVATLTRSPLSSGALRVLIHTNGGGLVQVPPEVSIPANQPAVTFNVNVLDDTLAYGSQTVNITANAIAQDGSPIPGANAVTSLTVRENDGPTLHLTFNAAVIEEGASAIGTVTRNTPPTNSLTVTLNAAPPGQAAVPVSVVIPQGVSSTNFNIAGVNDAATDGAVEVIVTASAGGFNLGSAPITVTDIDVPDLAVTEIAAPESALTDSQITVIWSVTNSGLASAVGAWVDEVYLATDAQGANTTLIMSVTNQGPFVVGNEYSLARSFLLPPDPGTYWVMVRTDARGALAEGSERNNAALSAAISVQPAYRATVSTTVDAAVSGTSIPLVGRTFYSSNGAPAAFRTATVRVRVNETRRTFSVLSDAAGNFSGVFQPIAGEAGVYTVGADHPRVKEDTAQDSFTLLGMAALPWELNLRLAPNLPATGRIEVRNLSPLPLTGLTVSPEGLPLDFTVNASVTNLLAGSQTNHIDYEIMTSLTTAVRGRFNLIVQSAEGATLRVPVDFTVTPPTAQLVAEPASLDYGMLRGAQTLVQLDVVNQGGVPSGNLSVALPVVPWLSLISTSPVPSLPPGGRTTLVLALSPPADLPLARYEGTIVLIGADAGLTVPFHFRALSEARGDLLLTVTDEHTYYASGAPGVTNATITLRDPITSDVVTNGTSDASGQVRFANLIEGAYVIEGVAPNRSRTRGGVRVVPGVTTEQEVFMSRQEVTYEWKVVPTTIEDHYRVVLQPQFETEVPQPNLVVENPSILAMVAPGHTSQFAIRLRNTGLIALERVRIPVPNHPSLIITPLVTEIETLPAQSSISVPVTVRVKDPAVGGFQAAGGGGMIPVPPACPAGEDLCVIMIPIDTRFRCGRNFVQKQATIQLEVVCLADSGCDFTSFLDSSSPSFFEDSLLAHRAEWDCIQGSMDECDKARVRGFLRSGDFGSVFFPQGLPMPPLPAPNSTNFGLSSFCACGPPERIPGLFAFGQALLGIGGGGGGGGGGATFNFVAAEIPGPCNAPFAAASAGPFQASATGPGVCAKVRLELSQDVTMTRAAFRGTLVLDNGSAGDITGIQLALDFRDAANQSAGTRFAIRGPVLSAITAIDGSGIVTAGNRGLVDYTFIPTLDAAPLAPASYTIGGTLRFTLDGVPLVIPLLPGQITVLPDARLQLEYFQQRDVFSDDPFTPELEPAEPFALGLRLKNTGAGIARNFRIASAAPRIIENEKGLLIDFKLLGATVDNDPFTPSFNLHLGDINPAQSKIVVWDMTSTLQGKFIDYRASFEHRDAFGATNISLIESVTLHEMIHVVRDDRPGADTLPDFLVNDSPDPGNAPDVVYLSNGSNAPVSLGINPVIDSPPATNDLQVQLTATMPAGWTYLRMTNPGPDFRLVSVRRSDGKQIRIPENAWTTDRTFPSSIPGALREKTLHLFDHDSTGIYTLTFSPIAQDTNAPSSAVTALAATSPSSFAVEWSGDDGVGGSGIAYFDIYVSVNGGTFSNWLARTTQHSAIFDGVNGNTYAFFSRATDVAGNQEITPASADAQTSASGMNTPPSLVPIADTTIDEGVLFTVLPNAIDTDVPRQTLSFSLLESPVGATVDAAGGFIRWQTGEAQGGTSYRFRLVVADNGVPGLSVTQSFNVIVRELNAAPFFVGPTSDVQVDEETILSHTVAASDTDLPTQALAWQLEPGAPVGMSIGAATGVLTWQPGESRGPGAYPIAVTVRDNGSPQQSASRILRVVVREVNRPPDLAPIPTQAVLVQTSLYVTNSATDPDIPAQEFFYSLAPGAPSGARIGRTNGVFSWTPTANFARSTNAITVRVTDNGVPSLTSSRTFSVVVGDVLEVRLGTGIVLAGQTGSVPVVVFTSVPATNATFTFEAPDARLGSFSVDSPVAPLGSATLQSLGGNRYRVRLGAAGSQQFAGEQTLSRLRFVAASGQASAFVPLLIADVSGTQTDGQPVPRALGSPGRVVYLGPEPLLEALRNNGQVELHLYARPAVPGYTVESTLNLNPIAQWLPFWNGPVNNLLEVLTLSPTNRAQFFRARAP